MLILFYYYQVPYFIVHTRKGAQWILSKGTPLHHTPSTFPLCLLLASPLGVGMLQFSFLIFTWRFKLKPSPPWSFLLRLWKTYVCPSIYNTFPNCLVIFCCCCSVAKSCLILRNPMDCSTSDPSILHYLPEFVPIHVPWVSDVIQPSV